MTESQRNFSIAKTSTQENNIHHIKITRKKQLFLLFWIAEEDKAKKLFSEAAQTRLKNIKKCKLSMKIFIKFIALHYIHFQRYK
jgi:hypothetical protein